MYTLTYTNPVRSKYLEMKIFEDYIMLPFYLPILKFVKCQVELKHPTLKTFNNMKLIKLPTRSMQCQIQKD